MELVAYFKGLVQYIEISEEHVRISIDFWEFSDAFAVYNFQKLWRPGHRSKQIIAHRDFDGKEQWFIEFEKAVRQLHVGDAVKIEIRGIHSIYHIEKLSA